MQPILSDTSLERLTLDKSDREQTDTEVKILKAVDEQSHMYLTDLDIQVQFPCPCVTKAADSSLRASSYGVFQQVCFKCGFVASTTLYQSIGPCFVIVTFVEREIDCTIGGHVNLQPLPSPFYLLSIF